MLPFVLMYFIHSLPAFVAGAFCQPHHASGKRHEAELSVLKGIRPRLSVLKGIRLSSACYCTSASTGRFGIIHHFKRMV